MTNIDLTGLQGADANTAQSARQFDDFGTPLVEKPEAPLPDQHDLHLSQVTDAKLYLLMGNARRAVDTLTGAPLPEVEEIHDTSTLHTVLRTRHLLAEALLTLGGTANLQGAVDHCRAGLELATTSELAGKEPLYTAALFVALAESLRRRDGSIDAETTEALLELLEQTASQPDNRYRAIEYVGYRAHALSRRKRDPLRKHYLCLAEQARQTFLANTPSTPRQETGGAEDDLDKLRRPRMSPLLSALIYFPFPSQGQSSLPIANYASRQRY